MNYTDSPHTTSLDKIPLVVPLIVPIVHVVYVVDEAAMGEVCCCALLFCHSKPMRQRSILTFTHRPLMPCNTDTDIVAKYTKLNGTTITSKIRFPQENLSMATWKQIKA